MGVNPGGMILGCAGSAFRKARLDSAPAHGAFFVAVMGVVAVVHKCSLVVADGLNRADRIVALFQFALMSLFLAVQPSNHFFYGFFHSLILLAPNRSVVPLELSLDPLAGLIDLKSALDPLAGLVDLEITGGGGTYAVHGRQRVDEAIRG